MTSVKKSQVYPLLGILISLFIVIFGLVMAKSLKCLYFFGGVYILLFLFGMWRACLKVLPLGLILTGIFAGLTYCINRNWESAYAMANRLLAITIACIPGMSIRPVDLTRNLNQLHTPRSVTLGMMIVLSFMPLMRLEMKQIREAMKTRGIASIFNPKVFYRAFLIPLIMRLVNISDTLSLSVETRGFSMKSRNATVYKKVRIQIKDILLVCLLAAGAVCTVIL